MIVWLSGLRPYVAQRLHIPGSSNGRTADSGSASRGSNPRPGACKRQPHRLAFLVVPLLLSRFMPCSPSAPGALQFAWRWYVRAAVLEGLQDVRTVRERIRRQRLHTSRGRGSRKEARRAVGKRFRDGHQPVL